MKIESQAPGTDATQAAAQAGAEGGAPAAQGAAPTPEAKPAAAEIAYEFKAPEGMEFDKDSLADFTAVAKDMKLPAEAAQKLVDLAVKAETARAEAHVTQVAEWAAAVKADKELGGDKLSESVATAMKAIDLGPPELKQLLNESGLGNHPAVFKWAHAVGKALSEDRFVPGQESGATKSAAEVLYPSTSKS